MTNRFTATAKAYAPLPRSETSALVRKVFDGAAPRNAKRIAGPKCLAVLKSIAPVQVIAAKVDADPGADWLIWVLDDHALSISGIASRTFGDEPSSFFTWTECEHALSEVGGGRRTCRKCGFSTTKRD